MTARHIRLLSLCCFMLVITMSTAASGTISIIPKPVSVESLDGSFAINSGTVITFSADSDELRNLAEYLTEIIADISGMTLAIKRISGKASPNTVHLAIDKADDSKKENYTLYVEKKRATITGRGAAGVFYGIQSLRQIMMSNLSDSAGAIPVPCVKITDSPAYQWRGLLLDSARHFMTKEFVMRYIDLIAFHKMNVLHWHLTDDQGWRLESRKFPKLNEISSWSGSGESRHGGYYTVDDVREIVEYASQRYVTVVPEIEMPGHATAAIAAYPELSCNDKPIAVETTYGIHKNLFCAGKESTFEFMETILAEVSDMFPSKYIHIGGDEAKKDKWIACPHCQKRIKDEGLKDEAALQGYFTRRIDDYMQSLDRQIIGWDEILEGHPSKSAIVQSWRGMEGALEGSKEGHYVISSPHTHTYFDYPIKSEGINVWWMLILPLEKQYSFLPTPIELTPEQAKYILGGECTIWSERAPQPEVDYKVFPRLCSFSEVVWTQQKLKDFTDFSSRLDEHFKRLESLDVDYFTPSGTIANWEPSQMADIPFSISWDVSDIIEESGYYKFTMRHDEGENGIAIMWAALIEDGVEIVRDMHTGMTGKRNEDQNYRLKIDNPRKGAHYTLKVRMRCEGGTDSKGSVLVRHFKEK